MYLIENKLIAKELCFNQTLLFGTLSLKEMERERFIIKEENGN